MAQAVQADRQPEIVEVSYGDAGIFTWDIASNLLYVDSALAEIYGFDPVVAASGQPIEKFLERVHPEDRPRLAKIIGQGIVQDIPQQVTYRVPNAEGRYVAVTAFARSFYDKSSNPIFCSGIVVPAATAGDGEHLN
ncbi:PAS domain-containing protein [Rhizobium sp. RAF36]|uniref:PAS domain-containing protein n=1 Tax=Rhizobium sp. RAF36 TaxID=3233055 RepID=UPI003F9E9320